MHALVTGGAGFIGSYTVDLLLERGWEVSILDSLCPPVHVEGRVPDYVPLGQVRFIRGDVRVREDWERALRGVDVVVHLAAYQDYLTDFSKFFHVNTVGTALLFELIVEKRLPIQKVVFASSQATYGEGRYLCAHDGIQFPGPRPVEQLMRGQWEPECPACGGSMSALCTDEATVRPHNQYAMSKYTQEMIALNLGRRYGIPVVGLRYSITQGPRQSFHNAYSGILRIFTTRLLRGRSPVVYEDGKQLRDYVYVGDVARANLLALERDEANCAVFNVGGDRATSVLEYAGLVARTIGVDLGPVVAGHFRHGDTRHIISDSGRLRALGWSPTISLPEIVARYVAWVREQPEKVADTYDAAERAMLASGVLRESRAASLAPLAIS